MRGLPLDPRVAVTREMWRRGQLSHLLRPHGQRRAYKFIEAWSLAHPDDLGPVVLNCHRRMGKSFLLVLLAIERCLRARNQVVRYGTPTCVQTVEIVEPLIGQVLETCPSELRPEKKGHAWIFRNGSQLVLIGCAEAADNHRGKKSHLVVLDECADIPKFEYVVESVFSWHFAGLERPFFVLSSTPPRTIDHAFKTMADEAVRDGRYLKISTAENPDWTARDDRMLEKITHGKETTAWRREAGCEFVTDAESLIVPEFPKVKEVVVAPHPRPEHYVPVIAADFGWSDFTALLLFFVDFRAQLLVVEDEIVVKNMTTGQIAQRLREKEKAVFPNPPRPIRRVADNTPQGLDDWRRDHRIPFSVPEDRHDPEYLVAQLRTVFQEGKVRIHPRCVQLIYQLENCVRDERGKIERSEEGGHADAVMALAYGNRAAPWHLNPFPTGIPFDPERQALGRNGRRAATPLRGVTRAFLRQQLRPRFK